MKIRALGARLVRFLDHRWSRRLLPVVLALLAAGLAALYLLPRDRSFAVSAVTHGLTATLSGTAMNTWRLPAATICYRHEGRRPDLTQWPIMRPCNRQLFDLLATTDIEMGWADGARIAIERTAPGEGITVMLEAAGPEATYVAGRPFPIGSRLVIPESAWRASPVLTLSGDFQIGEVPAPGARRTLVSGGYEIREPAPWRQRAQAVSTGSFYAGDAVEIALPCPATGEACASSGFIDDRDSGAGGFGVTLYSPPADSTLRIHRFSAEPIEITPTWMERALKDSYLTALSVLFGVVTASASIARLFLTSSSHHLGTANRLPQEAPAEPKVVSVGKPAGQRRTRRA
jgi:hypothetical protein